MVLGPSLISHSMRLCCRDAVSLSAFSSLGFAVLRSFDSLVFLGEIRASPVAKALARSFGISLSQRLLNNQTIKRLRLRRLRRLRRRPRYLL